MSLLHTLREDVRTVFERDPAAKNLLEVLLCYPGLHAIWAHRVAHWFYCRRLFVAARLISHLARFLTGIEIHPGARLGHRVFIDHGMGTVIGETAEVGNDVTMYQGVTLGGTGKEKGKRHPTVEDGVMISAGAKVLGNITVGRGSRIGAGAVVIRPVPPGSTVVGVPGKVVRREGEHARVPARAPDLEHGDLPDPLAETLAALMYRLEHLEALVARLAPGGEPPVDHQDVAGNVSRSA